MKKSHLSHKSRDDKKSVRNKGSLAGSMINFDDISRIESITSAMWRKAMKGIYVAKKSNKSTKNLSKNKENHPSTVYKSLNQRIAGQVSTKQNLHKSKLGQPVLKNPPLKARVITQKFKTKKNSPNKRVPSIEKEGVGFIPKL